MAREVEQIEVLHRAAQAKLGITAALLGKHSFPSSAGRKPPSLDNWSELLSEQILELREISAELTITYYQLARWIETGYVLGAPLDGEGIKTGIDLLSSFLARVQAVEDLADSDTEIGGEVSSALRGNKNHPLHALSLAPLVSSAQTMSLPGRALKYDRFSFPKLDNSDKARRAIQTILRNRTGLDEKYSQILENAEDPQAALDKVVEILESSGSNGAGRADSLVLKAGRSIADYAHARDKRILLYARGTSGNPCAFCAMLASRGFVYWSATSASKSYRDGGMNSYHDNCHCFPIARWTEASELPRLNSYFQENWEPVTGKYSGDEKLKAWRRWMNKKRQESRTGVRTNSS